MEIWKWSRTYGTPSRQEWIRTFRKLCKKVSFAAGDEIQYNTLKKRRNDQTIQGAIKRTTKGNKESHYIRWDESSKHALQNGPQKELHNLKRKQVWKDYLLAGKSFTQMQKRSCEEQDKKKRNLWNSRSCGQRNFERPELFQKAGWKTNLYWFYNAPLIL